MCGGGSVTNVWIQGIWGNAVRLLRPHIFSCTLTLLPLAALSLPASLSLSASAAATPTSLCAPLLLPCSISHPACPSLPPCSALSAPTAATSPCTSLLPSCSVLAASGRQGLLAAALSASASAARQAGAIAQGRADLSQLKALLRQEEGGGGKPRVWRQTMERPDAPWRLEVSGG